MIQTSLAPTDNNILILPLPEEYRGKDIEVLIYSKDEILNIIPQKPPVTMGDFIGTFPMKDAETLRLNITQAREGWDRVI